jgi:hypothetical protein
MLWLHEPWIMLPGMERCSEKFSFPLGAIGLTCLGVLGFISLRKFNNGSTKPF